MPTRFRATDDPDAFIACQRLLSALLPPHRLRALLAASDSSPVAALTLPAAELTTNPTLALTPKQAERLREATHEPLPPNLLMRAQASDTWVISSSDPAYSHHLTPFPDAPPLLFVRGDLRPEDAASIAIVGSRRATAYGRGQAERFAQAFAAHGLTLVSGGAAGIDTAAHRGALAAGGRTVAVLGCGVDIAYPSENRGLFDEIVGRGAGALLSEFSMGSRPEPWRFPARNRLIAGMTRATLLIETPRDSGAMITARDAANYGRDVWAVPGPVDTGGRSRGCHLLIQDGAGLADCPEDVLRALGIAVEEEADTRSAAVTRPASAVRTRAVPAAEAPQTALPIDEGLVPIPIGLSDGETRLLATFDAEPRHGDEAGQRAGLAASEVSVALTLLEMKGLIQRRPGNLYVRVR